ncbi:hypothetical protein JTE90_001177 [Oedothorax gibbosus]|uniref:BTB domain-containing protein n=1 Tax=Oedothorax gibbosus TaxID=931172 RepID=A0AAV6TMN5_9ARAC|nr:hypothetical protein JTE90_001177 [Oedothorax gibbosus]
MSVMAVFGCAKKQNGSEEVVSNESNVDIENVGKGKDSGKDKNERQSKRKDIRKVAETENMKKKKDVKEVNVIEDRNEQVEKSAETKKKKIEKSTAHTKTYVTPENGDTKGKELKEARYRDVYGLPEFHSNPVVINTSYSSEQPNHPKFQTTRSDANLTKKATNKLKNVSRIRPDVTVLVRDREFRLHKKVLCEESSYFSKMMDPKSSRQYTLKLDVKLNISPDIFHSIMTFLYCGEMKPNMVSTLETICSASRVLGIQRAMEKSLKEISCHRKSLPSVLRSYFLRCATNGGKNSHFMCSLTSPCKPTKKSQKFRSESESYWNNILFTSVRGHYGQRTAMRYFPNHLKALPEKIKKKPTFEYLEYADSWTYGLDLLFN